MVDIERIRRERPLEELLRFCIVNLDKPSGPTSFSAARLVARILGRKKFAHFGTLDPKVTGVLPVALERACRLSRWFIKKDKLYEGVMRLHSPVPLDVLREEVKSFVGEITQLPPVRSRVKRVERVRRVYSWKLLGVEENGRDVRFRLHCEAGTYVRKLVHDLGERIGGAHMLELRRRRAGIFSDEDESFVTLERLREAVDTVRAGDESLLRRYLVPGEVVSRIMPAVEIRPEFESFLRHGRPVERRFLARDAAIGDRGGVFAVFCNDRFVEVAEAIGGGGEIVGRPLFVLDR